MPRASRYQLPGHIWHLTHRCHRRQFLLKFARDRRGWMNWLYQARKRYGLCVLDYSVTCNHVHLLVVDQGRDEIARSMQLVSGRVGQSYNRRKHRKGAFWEDRYHATAVDSDEYLARCLVYIALNMVRAGVVEHPAQWASCGYHEIQRERERYRIIDREVLAELLGMKVERLAEWHAEWVREAVQSQRREREAQWSESIAVGGPEFVRAVAAELGGRARYRRVMPLSDLYVLREAMGPYQGIPAGENVALRS